MQKKKDERSKRMDCSSCFMRVNSSLFSRHLADLASGKNLFGLLSVSASVVDVGVRETGSPHHDAAKGRVG